MVNIVENDQNFRNFSKIVKIVKIVKNCQNSQILSKLLIHGVRGLSIARVLFQPNFSPPPFTFETTTATRPDTNIAVMFPERSVSLLVAEARVKPRNGFLKVDFKIFLDTFNIRGSSNQPYNTRQHKTKIP